MKATRKFLMLFLSALLLIGAVQIPGMVFAANTVVTNGEIAKIPCVDGLQSWDSKVYYDSVNDEYYLYTLTVKTGTAYGGIKVYKFNSINSTFENITPAYDIEEGKNSDGNSLYFPITAAICTLKLYDGKLYVANNAGDIYATTVPGEEPEDDPVTIKINEPRKYFRVYDVASNPECPPLSKKYLMRGNNTPMNYEIFTAGDGKTYAYITVSALYYIDLSVGGTNFNEIEAIVNTSDDSNENITRMISAGAGISSRGICIFGNYLYTSSGDSTGGMINAFDISNPASPKNLGSNGAYQIKKTYNSGNATDSENNPGTYALVAVGDTLYINQWNYDWNEGFFLGMLDISNPAKLSTAKFTPYQGKEYVRLYENNKNKRSSEIVTDGRYLFCATTDGSYVILDTYNAHSPNFIKGFSDNNAQNANQTYGMYLTEINGDKYMVVSARGNGIAFYKYVLGDDRFQILEAEAALFGGTAPPTKSTSFANFSNGHGATIFGTTGDAVTGSSITLKFDTPFAGKRELGIRYSSNLSNYRTHGFNISVNGQYQTTVPVLGTGHGNQNLEDSIAIDPVTLKQGENTIELTFFSDPLQENITLNVDYIKIGHEVEDQGEIAKSFAVTDEFGVEIDLSELEEDTEAVIKINTLIQDSSNIVNGAKYYACLYDGDNKLLSVDLGDIKGSDYADKQTITLEKTIPASCREIKVLIWDDVSLYPLAK